MTCYWLVAITLFMDVIVCESCDSLHLNEWTGTHPVYRDAESPENASKSLWTCGRWCIAIPSCASPGSCWQVEYSGAQIATRNAYYFKKDRIGIGICMWQLIDTYVDKENY